MSVYRGDYESQISRPGKVLKLTSMDMGIGVEVETLKSK